jgi:pimeloyl-ACP methyl ester carboxylesterase
MGSEYLARTLGEIGEGRTVVLYDQRGRGASPDVADPASRTAAQDVADLGHVADAIGLRRFAVLGDHYGSAIAALYARRAPDRVSRLIVTSPLYLDGPMMMAVAISLGDTARLRRQGEALRRSDTTTTAAYCEEFWGMSLSPMVVADSAVVRALAPYVCAQSPERRRHLESDRRLPVETLLQLSLRDSLELVDVPTLVVSGRANGTLLAVAGEWAALLPHARVVVVDGWPQFPWIQGGTAATGAMRTFLAGTWPPEAKVAPPEARRAAMKAPSKPMASDTAP